MCLQIFRILCSRIAVTANSVPVHRKRRIIGVFVCKYTVKTILSPLKWIFPSAFLLWSPEKRDLGPAHGVLSEEL